MLQMSISASGDISVKGQMPGAEQITWVYAGCTPGEGDPLSGSVGNGSTFYILNGQIGGSTTDPMGGALLKSGFI